MLLNTFFVKSLLLSLFRLSFHYLAFTTFVAVLFCLLYFGPSRVPSRYSNWEPSLTAVYSETLTCYNLIKCKKNFFSIIQSRSTEFRTMDKTTSSIPILDTGLAAALTREASCARWGIWAVWSQFLEGLAQILLGRTEHRIISLQAVINNSFNSVLCIIYTTSFKGNLPHFRRRLLGLN
jgi:hypothetical protein